MTLPMTIRNLDIKHYGITEFIHINPSNNDLKKNDASGT